MATDLQDLTLLLAVIESGSITGGAHAQSLSLSAASTRISAMEAEHGVRFLHRSRRGVTPTAAGEVLARHAARVVAEVADLQRTVTAHAKGLRHEVRLASNSSAVDTLTEFLASALARFPQTTVILAEATSADALDQVRAGSADLAVISLLTDDVGVQVRELWDDSLVVVGLPRGAARSGGIDLREIVDHPLIGLTEGSPLQTFIEQQATQRGLTPAYRVRLPSLSAVCAVASTGAGPAIVPRGTARRLGVPPRATTELTEPWARRRALLVAATFDTLPEPAADFANALLRYRTETAG